MGQELSIDDIRENLTKLGDIIDDLPKNIKESTEFQSLKLAKLELETALEKDADIKELQEKYEAFLNTVTTNFEKSYGVERFAYSAILDVVMLIGYQIATTYKDCQGWYNDIRANYLEQNIQNRRGTDIPAFQDLRSKQEEMLGSIKELEGNTHTDLKRRAEDAIAKTSSRLEITEREITASEKEKKSFDTTSELRKAQANIFRAKRDEHVSNLGRAGKRKVEDCIGALKDLKNSISEKLGISKPQREARHI